MGITLQAQMLLVGLLSQHLLGWSSAFLAPPHTVGCSGYSSALCFPSSGCQQTVPASHHCADPALTSTVPSYGGPVLGQALCFTAPETLKACQLRDCCCSSHNPMETSALWKPPSIGIRPSSVFTDLHSPLAFHGH